MFDRPIPSKCQTKDTYQVSTIIGRLDSEISCTPFLKTQFREKTRLKFQNVIFHMYPLLTSFYLIYRGSQFLQFTTKLNPTPLIFDSPKVIFESHDLHFVMLLKVVNSDTNSIILHPRIYYYPKISRFKGYDLFLSYFQE